MSIVAKSSLENSEYSIDALSKCFLLGDLRDLYTASLSFYSPSRGVTPDPVVVARAEYRDTRGGFNAARARNSKANEKASLSILIRT